MSKEIPESDLMAEFRREEEERQARLAAPAVPLFGAGRGQNMKLQAWVQGLFGDDSMEASGFKTAAQALVETVRRGDEPVDVLVFPIVFCYRHCVELKLKSILRLAVACGYVRREEFDAVRLKHRLDKLWELLRPGLIEYDASLANDPWLLRVDERIAELHAHDPDSFSYRYRFSGSGAERRLPNGLPHLDIGDFCEGHGRPSLLPRYLVGRDGPGVGPSRRDA